MSVRAYTDKQILDRVRQCPSFRGFPKDYWLIGVRSNEDNFNKFDDKFYCFRGTKFVKVWKGTTNAGVDMLNPTNRRGEAVLKSGDIYYDSHERRLHRGKVLAYCQRRPLPIHRDADRDRRTEEKGVATNEIIGLNIHPASYQIGSREERQTIQGWSQGCQVFAIRSDFDEFMALTRGQNVLTYCLLQEWVPVQTFAGLSDVEIDDVLDIPRYEDSPVDSQLALDSENDLQYASSSISSESPSTEQPANATDAVISTLEQYGRRFERAENVVAKVSRSSLLTTIITGVAGVATALWNMIQENQILGVAIGAALLITAVWYLSKAKDRANERTITALKNGYH